jgi:clan AA aspartic protease (TIGR02281 family)
MKPTWDRIAVLIGLLLTYQSTHAEAVPIRSEHGTFVVPVLINGSLALDFTIDSGAADVSIPVDVFLTLRRTKTILDGDLLKAAVYELADGSQQTAGRFRIRSLRIGNLELHDVIASVAPVRGSLLLGQSFLSRLQTWSIDNERHLLMLNEGASQPASRSTGPQRPAENPMPLPVENARPAPVESTRPLQETYDTCVILLSAAQCTDLRQKVDEATPRSLQESLQDKYDTCVALLSAAQCTDLKQRLDEASRDYGPTHE